MSPWKGKRERNYRACFYLTDSVSADDSLGLGDLTVQYSIWIEGVKWWGRWLPGLRFCCTAVLNVALVDFEKLPGKLNSQPRMLSWLVIWKQFCFIHRCNITNLPLSIGVWEVVRYPIPTSPCLKYLDSLCWSVDERCLLDLAEGPFRPEEGQLGRRA